ncbi:hypothetical protein [Microvirga solisilvae]|uniref:hypothetical protein n=1 Tax=Microvirga solisilvae TaxID=2919498 RepID=UPI001FAEC735|nr:hypothetical protein [Microvirga solisilvae]
MIQLGNGEGYPGGHDPAVPPQEAPMSEETNNPLYILAAITLGIPIVALILLVATNPGVQEGMLSILAMFIVLSAFAVAAMFEIKRLADQPPQGKDHP